MLRVAWIQRRLIQLITPMASCFRSIRARKQIRQIIILCLWCCYILFVMLLTCADAAGETDTLLRGQTLRYGESLTSANNIFSLKFFRPGSSGEVYLGILYKGLTYSGTGAYKPVWVANRDDYYGFSDGSLMLAIDTADGLLKVYDNNGNTTISDSIPESAYNTSATILDNGNFVLSMLNPDGSIKGTLWQSFDYPSDTFLPGMKLGMDFRTGHNWSFTSWIDNELPGRGPFELKLDRSVNGSTELVMRRRGDVYWTSGPWAKGKFRNTDLFGEDMKFTHVLSENESYLTYFGEDIVFPLAKFRVQSNGMIDNLYSGPYPNCAVDSRSRDVGCIMGMLPKCRKADPQFQERRGVIKDNYYLYDRYDRSNLFVCKDMCRQNCSCVAFALESQGICVIFNEVPSFWPSVDGEVVYFLHTGRARRWWIWLVAAAAGTLLLLSIFCYFTRKRFEGKQRTAEKILLLELADTNIPQEQYSGVIDRIGNRMKNQVNLFSFESLEMATGSFCAENKLGQGGFGSVYKGILPSGQEIAIKRLSRSSGQGLLEFKNEILLIAKLQHHNLVKLLGCCTEAQEKILVYEYMPNRSLDFFLFDSDGRELIKWTKRMDIVEGVAQGLLYLHKYSRLRVIHRDLKASNILLDENMSPKISDFGMARIFGMQESEANTKRIVGTHGYMSPEYAIRGVFSMKSDVFSFGVLLLEIVSGKRNHGCYHSERPLNLIGLAWELWVEGRASELLDTTLVESCRKHEVIRCINVGLLCVQDNAGDRPSMTDVVSMLTNESLQLREPKQPAFFIDARTQEDESEGDAENPCTNDLTMSVMGGR